jgi:hypothetical protein
MGYDDGPECPDYTTKVPTGPGYQLWETTSEGSPISPVFESPEELAQWLVDNKTPSFASKTEDYETWLKFIQGPGWAPSAVGVGDQMISGVAAAVREEK